MRVGFQSCGSMTCRPSPAQMRPPSLSSLIKTSWINRHRPDDPTRGRTHRQDHGTGRRALMVNIAHLQKLNQGSEPRGEAREAGRLTPEAVVRPQEALLPPA